MPPIDPLVEAPETPDALRYARVMRAITATPWLIMPEHLAQICAIVAGLGDGPEAVEARIGKPLDNARSVTVRDGVAVIPVTGPIVRYGSMFSRISGATSIQDLSLDFNAALADPDVRAILLSIDSPGGAAMGVQEFADMVHAARGVKPVEAYIGGYGASAAYWIASAADRVVVADTAIVGSIGVITSVSTAKDKRSVDIVSTQSPHKRPDPATDAGRQKFQTIVDALASVFVSRVAAFRGVSEDTVLSEFGQGDVFVGADAVTQGLADATGSLEGEIAALARGKTVAMKRRPPSMPPAADTPTIDRAYLTANHPALVAEIRAEGVNEGRQIGLLAGKAEGAAAERDRIKAVEAAALPGHDALIEALKYDGVTTGADAALKVLAAHKATLANMGANLTADAPKPLHAAPPPEKAESKESLAHLPVEERCKRQWETDASVRDAHASLETFTAYEKAVSEGRVK